MINDFNFRKPFGRTFVGKQSTLAYDLARINRIGTGTFSPVTESYLGEVTYLSEGIFSRIVDAFKSVILKEPLLSKMLALRGLKKTIDPGAYAVKVKEVKTMTMSYLMKAGGIASAVIAFIEHKKIEKIVEILVEHVMLHHTQSMASIITHVLQLAMTSLHLVMSNELQGDVLAEKRVNGKVTDRLSELRQRLQEDIEMVAEEMLEHYQEEIGFTFKK